MSLYQYVPDWGLSKKSRLLADLLNTLEAYHDERILAYRNETQLRQDYIALRDHMQEMERRRNDG